MNENPIKWRLSVSQSWIVYFLHYKIRPQKLDIFSQYLNICTDDRCGNQYSYLEQTAMADENGAFNE